MFSVFFFFLFLHEHTFIIPFYMRVFNKDFFTRFMFYVHVFFLFFFCFINFSLMSEFFGLARTYQILFNYDHKQYKFNLSFSSLQFYVRIYIYYTCEDVEKKMKIKIFLTENVQVDFRFPHLDSIMWIMLFYNGYIMNIATQSRLKYTYIQYT